MIALIHPKRRKTHLAADTGSDWAPLCNVTGAPHGTAFTTLDNGVASISPDDDTVCLPCRRMIALVHIFYRSNDRGGRHLHIA